MDTTLPAPIGQLLDGRYLVESQIARGGMATVYLASDVRLERTVALKIAHQDLARDQDFIKRFISEARSVARLSSPNVVAVFDQGSTGDLHYIAMEYVPGPTLRHLIAARGRLDPREALDIIERVLAGLAAAHEAGIIHRDVKPENVLLGNGRSVKVADFGLARALAGAGNTKTGLLIGTAAYLAPEQVASSSADERSDVYAAGVMLFEMLTGVQPHTGDSPLDVAYKHVNSVVPAPSTLVPELPAAIDALVALGTSRDPELRPPDARHYLKAITEVRRAVPPPGNAQQPADRESWRPPVGTGLGAGAPVDSTGAAADGTGAAGLGEAASWSASSYGAADGPVTGEVLLPGHDPVTQLLTSNGSGAHASADLNSTGPIHGTGRESWAAGYPAQPGGGSWAATHTLIVPAGLDQDYANSNGYAGHRRERRYNDPILQRWLFSRRILFVLAAVVIAIGVWWLASGQYTAVPPVAGMTVSTARGDLTNAGLTVVTGAARHSDTVPAGQVITTDPAAGGHISHGGTVTIIPSLGPVLVAVPPVTGQPLAQAEHNLKAAGLTPGHPTYQTSSSIPAGLVLSTYPAASQHWPKNKPVQLVVSSGQPLPNFVGQQVTAAQGAASAGGYSVNPVPDTNSSQPPNTIIRQSPAAGTPITSGEVVTVYYSSPQMVNVPDVTGMDANQAQSVLQQAGFQVQVNSMGPGQTVGSYSPTGQAQQGATITINVGLFGGFGN
ncbi:MAG TPA: PASTA domain-containing protein [Streptosporangiaceae bacterium]|nr:PASTA domain-containing protein [Streptosporangiaceae bacterium]